MACLKRMIDVRYLCVCVEKYLVDDFAFIRVFKSEMCESLGEGCWGVGCVGRGMKSIARIGVE